MTRLLSFVSFAPALLAPLAGAVLWGLKGGATKPGGVREPALAGTWYPGPRALVVATARHLMRLASAAPAPPGRPVALVAPHAGWTYSGVAAGAAFRLLSPGSFARVVVVAPSHYGGFRGYALDDAGTYRTPAGDIPVDLEAVEKLKADGLARKVPGVTEPEHALEIELPFLQAALGPFRLVPVLVGQTSAEDEKAFAARLALLDDGKTLFVFSSDFTHYGPRFEYQPFGRLTTDVGHKVRHQDGEAVGLLASLDAAGFRGFLDQTGATICGRHGLSTMVELLSRIAPGAHASVLAHYASAELPFVKDDGTVDYVAMAFTREPVPPAKALTLPPPETDVPADAPPLPAAVGARLPRLARAALQTQLIGTDALSREMASLPVAPELFRRQGVFVTINRTDPAEVSQTGKLRGCIGQVFPEHPLEMAVVRAALDAALGDPRFPEVEARELPRLAVEVTVLSPIRPVASWHDIVIGKHGIVLEKQGRRALFLPQVAPEWGWTLEETLGHLSQKAGLPPDAWKEGARFSVFTGQVFHEERRP
ncbi:AmmeMemoRadiSam system protein B [Acidobacteria bacterium ACD]|nr:MAG: AmmeMemoRadiSam system protein B [Acidobacteriota bacterium]MDL1952285.1 AmmeMemoRadiSam system protein B [Acidobacteria bacterium ACD]